MAPKSGIFTIATTFSVAAAATAKSLQSCLTLRPHRRQPIRLPRPWDSPGKNTGVGCHFLLQCVKVKVKLLSRVRLFATPWTAAYQAPLSMGFSRQEYWSGVPLPSLFTLIKRLFSSSSLSAIRVVSSAYVRLLIFLPAILIPACASSRPAFHMMNSV